MEGKNNVGETRRLEEAARKGDKVFEGYRY